MRNRRTLHVQAVLTGVFTFLFILTLAWRDWIEKAIGVDPDQHNGTVEWLLVAGFAVAALMFGILTSRELRRLPRT